MRKLKGEGIAILFITHFLDQVYEVSDRVSVLRNGALVGMYQTAALSRLALITLMLGRSLTETEDIARQKIESGRHIGADALLEADGHRPRRDRSSPSISCFTPGRWSASPACSGPVRTEMAQLLFGIDQPTDGLDDDGRQGRSAKLLTDRLDRAWASRSAPRTGRPKGSWPT